MVFTCGVDIGNSLLITLAYFFMIWLVFHNMSCIARAGTNNVRFEK